MSRPVSDVQVTRLLGVVTVESRGAAGQGDKGRVVVGEHRVRHVRLGVAVRPQDDLTERVPAHGDLDLLHPADYSAAHEVAVGRVLRRGPGVRAAVLDAPRIAAGTAAASP